MPLPIFPILATVAQAGYQFYQGKKQEKLAKNLKQSNYVPPSIKEAVAGARMEANSTAMPGYGRAVNRLKTSTANTIARTMRSSKNSGVIQQGVADADAREKEVLKDLEVANESFRANSRGRLNNLLGVQAGHERASYDNYNQAKSALTGSSMMNKYNAFSGLTENLLTLHALNNGFTKSRRNGSFSPIDTGADWFSGFNS